MFKSNVFVLRNVYILLINTNNLAIFLKYLTYIGVFSLTLYVSRNNNRIHFLLKAIIIVSFLFSTFLFVYYILFSEQYMQSYRIKLINDRVIDSEIIISIIGFTLYSLLGILKNKMGSSENFPSIRIFNFSGKTELRFGVLTVLILTFQSTMLISLRTRMAWISLFVMCLIMILILYLFYSRTFDLRRLISFVAGILILSLFVSTITKLYSQSERNSVIVTVKSIFDKDYYSNQARLSFWLASLKMIQKNPVLGIGSGNWAGLYPSYNGEFYNDENVDLNSAINPHNDFLEIMSEYGILGFLIFTGPIFYGVFLLYRKSKDEIIYLPFLLSAIGLCITMCLSFTKDNFWPMVIFSICMGVGYSSNSGFRIQNLEYIKRYNQHIKKFMLLIGVVLLCMGIWFKVMSYFNERDYLDAMKLKAQGKYTEMLGKLEDVSSIYYPVDMNKMPVDYYRGVGYFELGQYDKALEKFKGARNYMEYYPTIMSNEASALYMTGNFIAAEELYLEVKKLFPNFIESQINLLSFYTNQRRTEEAKNLIVEIDSKPFNPKYVKNYSVYLKIKNYFKGTTQ